MQSHGLLIQKEPGKASLLSSPSDLVLISRGSSFHSSARLMHSLGCLISGPLIMFCLWYVTHSPLKPCPLFHLSPHLSLSVVPNILPGAERGQDSSKCFMRILFFFAGWYEGERLRDGERGWFPMECAKEITCQATIDKNVERMGRLLGLETNV